MVKGNDWMYIGLGIGALYAVYKLVGPVAKVEEAVGDLAVDTIQGVGNIGSGIGKAADGIFDTKGKVIDLGPSFLDNARNAWTPTITVTSGSGFGGIFNKPTSNTQSNPLSPSWINSPSTQAWVDTTLSQNVGSSSGIAGLTDFLNKNKVPAASGLKAATSTQATVNRAIGKPANSLIGAKVGTTFGSKAVVKSSGASGKYKTF